MVDRACKISSINQSFKKYPFLRTLVIKRKMDSIFHNNKHGAKDICFHAE